MPTYQYACTACSHELEAVQSFSDDPLAVCPACAGRLRKVFSAVGVVFKGSGFYRTDSRASNGGDGAKTSEGTNGSTKSESTSSNSSNSGDSGKASAGKGDSGKASSGKSSSGGGGGSAKNTASTGS